MPRFRPSELLAFLKQRGLAPKKGLSQNFLIDGNILSKIVREAAIQPGDHVLEIGPGPGALTEQLLLAGAKVSAVEKDPGFAAALPSLAEEIGCGSSLDVYTADILSLDLKHLLSNGHPWKVVANLPYHLTSPILAKLVPLTPLFSDLYVMVQEEVARRMVSQAGSREHSSFSVFLQFYCSQRRYAFKVGRRCFIPAPKVDSAVVHLSLHKPPHVDNPSAFLQMMRSAFQQKRKMLRRSLGNIYGPSRVEAALEEMGKPVNTRPEDFNVQDFIALWTLLNESASP